MGQVDLLEVVLNAAIAVDKMAATASAVYNLC
jgi:hypothetical protein